MIKTVQEIIEDIMDAPNYNEYYIANVDDLDEIKRAYENEIAEKDKQIKNLEKEWEKLVCEKYDLQQTQLYKEDFIVHKYCINCRDEEFPFDNKCRTCGWDRIIKLKDNSKYDKLPSKDVK